MVAQILKSCLICRCGQTLLVCAVTRDLIDAKFWLAMLHFLLVKPKAACFPRDLGWFEFKYRSFENDHFCLQRSDITDLLT